LTLLLSAQAAQLSGDGSSAKKLFTAMLDRPETEFPGLRGLLQQALLDGDRDAARRLAERAAALRPSAKWALTSVFDLAVRDGRWEEAQRILDAAVKHHVIPRETARHHRAVILHELSVAAAERGDRQLAVRQAGKACSLAADLAPPVVHLARLLLADGRRPRAAKVVERAWRTAPHPELAQIYGEIWQPEAPLTRMTHFQHLAEQNPSARESRLVVADAALQAQLWGEARSQLEQAMTAALPMPAGLPGNAGAIARTSSTIDFDNGPSRATPRLCLMMARLEEAEHGDLARIREWLDRAFHALPDPRYVCAHCGGETAEWRPLCPRCGRFDTLCWRTPAGSEVAAIAPMTPLLRPAEKPAAMPIVATSAGNSQDGRMVGAA
jgi:HemY protein